MATENDTNATDNPIMPENPLDMANSGHKGIRKNRTAEKTQTEDQDNEAYSLDDFDLTPDESTGEHETTEDDLTHNSNADDDLDNMSDDDQQDDDTSDDDQQDDQQDDDDDLQSLNIDDQNDADDDDNSDDQNQNFPDRRNYDQFTKEDAELLKKVPNHVYASVEKRFAEIKQREERLAQLEQQQTPASFYENPEAVTLLPSYKEIDTSRKLAATLATNYREQLNNLESGEDIVIFRGFDKDNNPIVDTIKPVAIKDEEGNITGYKHNAATQGILLQEMSKYSAQTEQYSAQLNQLKQQYTSSYDQVVNGLKVVDQKLFSADDVKDATYKKNMEQMVKHLPQQFQNHPLSSLVAKGYASYVKMFNQLKAENDKLKQQLGLKKIKDNDQSRAGLTSNKTKARRSSDNNKKEVYDIDEFDF